MGNEAGFINEIEGLEIKIGKNDVCMGELGKREGGGFLLRFGWCRGSARKRMLIPGFFYFPATGAGLWQGFQTQTG
jgi:hypothetical protein